MPPALMPLGLDGASEMVAAPLVSSHAYALQQHSTLVDTLKMHTCDEVAGQQDCRTPELQAAGTAALHGHAARPGAAPLRALRKRDGQACMPTCSSSSASGIVGVRCCAGVRRLGLSWTFMQEAAHVK